MPVFSAPASFINNPWPVYSSLLPLLLFLSILLFYFAMGGFLSHLKPEQNSEILQASCGPIRGNVYRHDTKLVDGYLGIPYAQPPIGNLRYKKPEPMEKWAEPIDCYQYGPGCPQSGGFSVLPPEHIKFGEDNCLTLNVFAPRAGKDLPVMVYFYGGGFEIGFSALFNDYSLSGTLPLKEVIVVTANYRVGPLGFLTIDDVAKGNYGLWDQTLALRWVQQHIHSFGGDNHNVTIFGTSAGGASVDLLALSPHSNQLFHRYIAMSGTAYCDWAVRTQSEEARIAKQFAEFHGYSGASSEDLLHWYQNVDVEKFKQVKGFDRKASGFVNFVPNFDGDFFPKPFDELRRDAPKLDAMITVGEYEGLGWNTFEPDYASNIEYFKKAIHTALGEDVLGSRAGEIGKEILNFYTKNVNVSDKAEIDLALTKFIGDSWFNLGALLSAKSSARHHNKVYLGSFDYYNMEAPDPRAPMLPFRAAAHGSDLRYTLGEAGLFEFKPVEEELKVMDMMGSIVANFAKHGNPNCGWEPYTLSQPNRYFKIDYPVSKMVDGFQDGRLESEVYKDVINGEKYQEIYH